MLDPNAPEQTTQPRKLVLPAHPGDQLHPNDRTQHVRPEQLIRQNSAPPPAGPLTKLRYFWSKDPAYKILILAVAAVVVSALIFSVLGTIALIQNSNGATQDISIPQNPPTATSPGNPTFPTPGGTSGSTTSSQPPKHATITVTPDVTSTAQQPSGQNATVQITYAPNVVANNSQVTVEVATNQPSANVELQVRYSGPPYYYTSQPRQTDSNGAATLLWRVHVRGSGFGQVAATVIAVLTDQNGVSVTSAPVIVTIYTQG
jgi:cytoskeletal protein RodZ